MVRQTAIALFLLCVFAAAAGAGTAVRSPAVAGRFYPADPAELRRTVERLLAGAPAAAPVPGIRGLIVPHAGYVYSGATAARAYAAVRGSAFRTVMILAPSHYSAFRGLSIPDVSAYRTPLGDVPLASEACRALRRASPLIAAREAAHAREHSVEVELPFLQATLGRFSLIPILVGRLEPGDYPLLADLLAPYVRDGTLLVASSDFTHYGPAYGYVPFTREVERRIRDLDSQALDRILALDRPGLLAWRERTGATICGIRGIGLLLELLRRGPAVRGRILGYTTSGALAGDFTNSVSYAAVLFHGRDPVMSLTPAEKKSLLVLARRALEARLRDGRDLADPPPGVALSPRLREPAGAFVTLERDGELRGCIGFIEPIRPLYRAVMENAVSAATRDFRFPPVEAEELPRIRIEISVLTPLREIPGPEAFEPGRHGIVLEKQGHRAVFLPQVAAERGWDRETTLEHLCRKAGLPPDAWRRGARFQVFEAEVFREQGPP